MDDVKQEVWAIVELMGHVKLAGKLSETEQFGGKLGRLDIPDGDGFVTRLFGAASVYSITYVTEEVARHVQKQRSAAPVASWDFPKALPERVPSESRLDRFDQREDDDDRQRDIDDDEY